MSADGAEDEDEYEKGLSSCLLGTHLVRSALAAAATQAPTA